MLLIGFIATRSRKIDLGNQIAALLKAVRNGYQTLCSLHPEEMIRICNCSNMYFFPGFVSPENGAPSIGGEDEMDGWI